MANLNRRNNSIEQLVVNGIVSSDQSEIREHSVQYYDSLFTEHHSWRPRLNGLLFVLLGRMKSYGLSELLRKKRSLRWW